MTVKARKRGLMLTAAMAVMFIAVCAYVIPVQSGSFDEMVNGQLKKTIPVVQPEALKKWLDTESSVYLLDAREENEFRVSHLAGAQWVGYEHFRIFPLAKLDKSKTVVVYCSIGVRSEKIAEKLKKAGFTNVYNLFGGIFKWINSGYPLVNDKGVTTDIHPYNSKWGKWLTKGNKRYE